MNATMSLLLVVFWTPILVVSIFNLLWDLYFWQTCDYQFSKFYQKLKWDNEISHRKQYLNWLKLVATLLLISYLLNTQNILPTLGLCLLFAVWFQEALDVITKLRQKRYPPLELSLKNILVLIPGIALNACLPLISALFLLSTWQNLPADVAPTSALSLLYLSFILSSFMALGTDLGSPLITTFLVIITKPAEFVLLFILYLRAVSLTSKDKKRVTIIIIGSYGKTTVRKVLVKLLKNNYKVLALNAEKTNFYSLVRGVVRFLKPNTEVFISELNPSSATELAQMMTLLRPQITVFTGLGEEASQVFGSIEHGVTLLHQTMQQLSETGLAVINADDELLQQLYSEHDGREILYSVQVNGKKGIENKYLELEHIVLTHLKATDSKLNFDLTTQAKSIPLQTDKANQGMLHSILAGVAVASELGIGWKEIGQKLAEIKLPAEEVELTSGDNDMLLVIDRRETTLRRVQNICPLLTENTKPGSRRAIITSGLKALGKQRERLSDIFARFVSDNFQTIVTTDPLLHKQLLANNTSVSVYYSDSLDQLLYLARTQLRPNDIVLITGELSGPLLQELASNLS